MFVLDDCSCSDFVTKDGYGNCTKTTKNEPEKGPFCYVNIPTTCSDVIVEDSQAPTGYSWEACNNKKGTERSYNTYMSFHKCL